MSLNLYHHIQNKLSVSSYQALDVRDHHVVWYDLMTPAKDEENWLESTLGIEIPTRDEMHEIELSNRLYQENNAVYCTGSIITKADSPEPEIHAISFILKDNALITLRYSDPYSFRKYAKLLPEGNIPAPASGAVLMVGLLEESINRIADLLETSGRNLDAFNRALFRPSITQAELRQQDMPDFEAMLRDIGIHGDLLSKIRESLLSLSRVISFVCTTGYFPNPSEIYIRCQILLKDIAALTDHAGFLSGKVSFLLDATLGMVNIQQTSIIKIFSVASVVFLPPTLVASIYGMNFQRMPELGWSLGYPLAIVMMLLSAWLPYRLFKKKKWL